MCVNIAQARKTTKPGVINSYIHTPRCTSSPKEQKTKKKYVKKGGRIFWLIQTTTEIQLQKWAKCKYTHSPPQFPCVRLAFSAILRHVFHTFARCEEKQGKSRKNNRTRRSGCHGIWYINIHTRIRTGIRIPIHSIRYDT